MPSRLGQHFLKNKQIIEKIISSCQTIKNQTIIEIGPGQGALTIPLAGLCQKNNNQLIAIEKDKRLAVDIYRKELPNTTVEYGDIRKLLPETANKLAKKGQTYSIVGNIPYYLTGFLLRIISELPEKPEVTILMIQKEVGDRLTALAPNMNKLAAATGAWASAKSICFVPKKDFSPPPKVNSVVVELAKKQNQLQKSENYYKTVRALFQQPRKTIANNLKSVVKNENKHLTQEKLEKIGIQLTDRPQNLSIDQIIKLSEILF